MLGTRRKLAAILPGSSSLHEGNIPRSVPYTLVGDGGETYPVDDAA